MIAAVAPARQQPVDADRVDHRAGQDVGADLRSLLQEHDGEVGIDLLEADRRGETGRPGADDHHVEFHAFAFRLAHAGLCTPSPSRVSSPGDAPLTYLGPARNHRAAATPACAEGAIK